MRLSKFFSKFWKDKSLTLPLYSFLAWKLYIALLLVFSFSIPLAGTNFLGGSIENYLSKPFLFAFANFDGEHYLSIAEFGYKALEQAFFPVYPWLMYTLAWPFGINLSSLVLSGLLISHLAFLVSLILLFKLIRLDYSFKLAQWTMILVLVFPTSFYFGAVYSESIFLLFSLLAFYFARQKRWILATIFGIISSATRVFGFLLLPAFFLESIQQKEKFHNYFWIIFIPLGLIAYMYYQYITVGDPLAFYNLQEIVGEQHQSGITLLPQVWFRYIKILLTTSLSNSIYLTAVLEFVVGILFFILPIYGYFKKIRWSYVFYALAAFLLPTIQGSFSSVPRYVLVLFPSFLSLAIIFDKLPKFLKVSVIGLSLVWLSIETSLFLRGYWVA